MESAMDFDTLSQWAGEEVGAVLATLPPELQKPAKNCSITFEERPGRGLNDDTLEGDELGLFEGPSLLDDAGASADVSRVRLFLANLWEWVEQDEEAFRDEVGITLLHELGHYFGWEEHDLEERGLD